MTNADTSPDTDIPDIGFSVAELQYLLSVAPGPIADRSAEVFNVGPIPTEGTELIVGAGALLAHGLLEMVSEDDFQLREAALVISYILTNATRWTVIGGATDEGGDLGVFVQAPAGALLAQPRVFGTWWFVLIGADAPADEIVISTATSFADAADATGVYVRPSTLVTDETFSIRRVGSTWGYAAGTSESDTPALLVDDATRESTLAALAEFLGSLPEPGEQ